MLTKNQLITVVFAVHMADHINTKIKAYKTVKLCRIAAEAYEETQRRQTAQINYLCEMLNKNGIGADEFDMIALHNPIPED